MLGSNIDIMGSQWTDVIFKDRNQAYGAYQLRKDNAYNTNRALMIAIGMFVTTLAVPTIVSKMQGDKQVANIPVHVVEIPYIQTPITIEKPKPQTVQPQKQVRSQHDMIRSLPPVAKADAVEDPPTVKQLETANPGPQTITGIKDAAPVIDEKTGPVEIKGSDNNTKPDAVFETSEIPPLYPGGEKAFGKFLSDHIRYPAIAKENGVTGRVFLQFIVERDGSLTDMKILRDPGSGLGEEAARVLKISPHWAPGIQNGKKVRVQFTVPINFSLNE